MTGRAPGRRVVAEIHGGPARHPADHRGHSAGRHRRAGRHHAERGAPQRAGHHAAGRRRRRRVEHRRRHVQHARLQRRQQPLRRRRARRRADLARRLQPRAGRGVHGADRHRRRPRHGRRLRQHADEDAAPRPRRSPRFSPSAAPIRSALTVDVNQPLPLGDDRQLAQPIGGALNVLWQDSGVPGRDVVEQERRAIAPVAGARPRHADPRRRSPRRSCGRTTCPTTAFPAPPGRRNRSTPTTVQAPRAGRSEQLLRQPRLRLRQGASRTATPRASSTTSTPRLTLRNQTRYNRARARSDHHDDSERRGVQPDDQPGDARASGQRAREHDRLEPDQRRRRASRPAGCSMPRAAASSSRSEEQVAPTLGPASARGRRSTSSPRIPHDPVIGFAPARTGASTTGKTNTVGVLRLRHGRAAARSGK